MMIRSAVIRQFEIIGEASTNVSEELKKKNPDIEWATIKGFRNLLFMNISELMQWKFGRQLKMTYHPQGANSNSIK